MIADAVRLLGWGKQWHELADMIARLAERPAPVGNPPHPAHLSRPDRRRRDPPRATEPDARDYKRVIWRAQAGRALREAALLSKICAPTPRNYPHGAPL